MGRFLTSVGCQLYSLSFHGCHPAQLCAILIVDESSVTMAIKLNARATYSDRQTWTSCLLPLINVHLSLVQHKRNYAQDLDELSAFHFNLKFATSLVI